MLELAESGVHRQGAGRTEPELRGGIGLLGPRRKRKRERCDNHDGRDEERRSMEAVAISGG